MGVTAFADDADGTDTVTYSLDDDAGGRFTIDTGTGVVTVAGGIDREAAASYDITVRAASADGSSSTQTFTIAVNDLDEFDVGAVVDTDASANTVAEAQINAVPTIFMPYPHHRDQHQRHNAKGLVDLQGAILVDDLVDGLKNAEQIERSVGSLLEDSTRLCSMAGRLRRCRLDDGAEVVARWIVAAGARRYNRGCN